MCSCQCMSIPHVFLIWGSLHQRPSLVHAVMHTFKLTTVRWFFLAFLCTFDDKILVCYLVVMQDDSCLVVSQSYQCISSVFPPCLSEHTGAVMNSTLKNVLYFGHTDTKSSINYPEYPEFEESAQGSCAGNSICPFTAPGWILSWKQESLRSNRCSHEHIKLIYTPEMGVCGYFLTGMLLGVYCLS